MTVSFGLGLALASLVLIPWSVWRLIRHRERIRWWWAIPVLPAGVALAFFFHHAEYMAAPDLKVAGFPIPAAFFERDAGDGFWRDYVGCLTPVAIFGNPLIGLGLPLIPLAVLTLFRKRSEAPR